MTPQKAFNHHLTQALATLRDCPPEFIGPASRAAIQSFYAVKNGAVANLFAAGQITSQIEAVFGTGAVNEARRKLGQGKMPMRYKTALNPYPVDWLDELKKPGDVTVVPCRTLSQRTSMSTLAITRGITIQTRTRGVPKGFIRITCLRNVDTENKERAARVEVGNQP